MVNEQHWTVKMKWASIVTQKQIQNIVDPQQRTSAWVNNKLSVTRVLITQVYRTALSRFVRLLFCIYEVQLNSFGNLRIYLNIMFRLRNMLHYLLLSRDSIAWLMLGYIILFTYTVQWSLCIAILVHTRNYRFIESSMLASRRILFNASVILFVYSFRY